ERILAASERELAIQAIASFVIRRMAAKYQTRGYGQTFSEVLKAAHGGGLHSGLAVIAALREGPHGYNWPTTEEIAEQFSTARYYGGGGINQERIKLILGSIDRNLHRGATKTEPLEISYDSLQVEHVIPQEWRMYWPVKASDANERIVQE